MKYIIDKRIIINRFPTSERANIDAMNNKMELLRGTSPGPGEYMYRSLFDKKVISY